jgi:DNA-directed RNA polymerase specialized sigma24 family protein
LKNPRREHIILLHFFLGLNASEVARQLQMAVAQFHVEKSRALKKLKKCCPEKIRRELHSQMIPSF